MKNRMIYQMKNKVRNLTYFLLLIGGTALTQSCSYLDVVPDKIGTIDNSFTNRNEAEKYLNTCYSYIPGNDSPYNNVALMGNRQETIQGWNGLSSYTSHLLRPEVRDSRQKYRKDVRQLPSSLSG
jgi:hypothetical protein